MNVETKITPNPETLKFMVDKTYIFQSGIEIKNEKEAKKFKINSKDRIGHLIVHSTLHLLGYDHKTKIDEKKMISIESKILNSLEINYY